MNDRAWNGLSKAVAEGGFAARSLPAVFIDEAIRDLQIATPDDVAGLEALYALPAREPRYDDLETAFAAPPATGLSAADRAMGEEV